MSKDDVATDLVWINYKRSCNCCVHKPWGVNDTSDIDKDI